MPIIYKKILKYYGTADCILAWCACSASAALSVLCFFNERIKSNFSMYLLDNQLIMSLLPVVSVGLQNRLKRRFGCCERRKVSKYCIDYEDFQWQTRSCPPHWGVSVRIVRFLVLSCRGDDGASRNGIAVFGLRLYVPPCDSGWCSEYELLPELSSG